MTSSSTVNKRFSPSRAVLMLGIVTALAVYGGVLVIDLFTQFVLHWGEPFQNGTGVDSIAGSVAVAVLNMLLWWLSVVVPKSARMEGATLAGLLCGVVAPTVLAVVNLFFGWLVRGYFLNYQDQPSTSWQDISWPLSAGPIVFTVFYGWFTLLVCILLDRWMVRQTYGKQ